MYICMLAGTWESMHLHNLSNTLKSRLIHPCEHFTFLILIGNILLHPREYLINDHLWYFYPRKCSKTCCNSLIANFWLFAFYLMFIVKFWKLPLFPLTTKKCVLLNSCMLLLGIINTLIFLNSLRKSWRRTAVKMSMMALKSFWRPSKLSILNAFISASWEDWLNNRPVLSSLIPTILRYYLSSKVKFIPSTFSF